MRVLVTGAAGRIGTAFAADATVRATLELVRTDVVDEVGGDAVHRADAAPDPVRTRLDVTDAAACRRACQGVDAVLHLAADPRPDADFASSVLPLNIVGTHHVVTAAVEAGVPRVVVASSAQAVEGYPRDRQVRESDAPCPANDYGVSKAFAESLCASLAVRSTTTFVAVRVGNHADRPPDPSTASFRDRTAWVSPRDTNQLLRLALTRPVDGFLVVHGVSDNAVKRLAIGATRAALGYQPVDDAFEVPNDP
jgi:uronate dehydrogenase